MADLLELFCGQTWGDDRRNALTVAVPVKKKGCGLFFITLVLMAGVSKLRMTLVLLIVRILHCPSCS